MDLNVRRPALSLTSTTNLPQMRVIQIGVGRELELPILTVLIPRPARAIVGRPVISQIVQKGTMCDERNM